MQEKEQHMDSFGLRNKKRVKTVSDRRAASQPPPKETIRKGEKEHLEQTLRLHSHREMASDRVHGHRLSRLTRLQLKGLTTRERFSTGDTARGFVRRKDAAPHRLRVLPRALCGTVKTNWTLTHHHACRCFLFLFLATAA